MDTIQITKTSEKALRVITPFHPDFSGQAHKLNGRYHRDPPHWIFDLRQEKRVRALCRSIFGSDGTPGEPTVCIRLRCVRTVECDQMSVFFAGRMLARAYGRDSEVRFGSQVVLAESEAEDGSPLVTAGGSQKNWKTIVRPGAEIEVYDLPEAALPSAEAAAKEGWKWDLIARPALPHKAGPQRPDHPQASA